MSWRQWSQQRHELIHVAKLIIIRIFSDRGYLSHLDIIWETRPQNRQNKEWDERGTVYHYRQKERYVKVVQIWQHSYSYDGRGLPPMKIWSVVFCFSHEALAGQPFITGMYTHIFSYRRVCLYTYSIYLRTFGACVWAVSHIHVWTCMCDTERVLY